MVHLHVYNYKNIIETHYNAVVGTSYNQAHMNYTDQQNTSYSRKRLYS